MGLRGKTPETILPVVLHLATATEYGKRFETGVPVTFKFVRNTEKAPPAPLRDEYQQRIEPAGRYMLHGHPEADVPRGWEAGTVSFKKPLVIKLNAVEGRYYDENSWKKQLERHYGKRGRALSRAIVKDGYDAVVTVIADETREIVDLTWLSS